jgi:hypothetical protein
MNYETNPQSSTRDDEKILRALMLADRVVLRRRADKTADRLTPEGRAAIRAARQRQAARNHQKKSQPAPSPGHNPGGPTMADYHTPEARTAWGEALDTAERENKNEALIRFAECSYRRECTHAADEAVERLVADRNFRPSIPDVWRTYDAWQAAELRILDVVTHREVIDAELDAIRLYRIANLTRAAWEANHGPLGAGAGDTRRGPTVRVRRVKRAPTKYVRGPNGVKLPRSKSYVPH